MMHGEALKYLRAAVKLHKAHMDGTEPTSAASQRRLMRYLEAAAAALAGQKHAPPARKSSGFFG